MKFVIFSVLIFILALVIKPLTIPGFFPIHDDTQVSRVYEMEKALDDGMFPVRWSKDLGYGYGYPMFNFYAPLSYYAGGTVTFFGVDPIISTKLLFAAALIFSALNMFLLGNLLCGKFGGSVSAVLYLLAPYNAVNIFVRGNIAEAWGYAFIPLFFYGLFGIYKKAKFRFVVIGSVGFAAIILSHNLTAFEVSIFTLLTLLFIFFSAGKRVLKLSFLSILLGVLISSFYFIPAIAEAGLTNVQSQIGAGADFRNHFVCLGQLWDSPWGFGGSAPGCADGLSFRIGKLHLILVGLFLLLFFKDRKKAKEGLNYLIISFFILSVFFMLGVSKPIWEFIKPMAYIQYPWRFLTLASFSSSLLSGQIIHLLDKNFPRIKYSSLIFSAIIILSAALLYVKLFQPQTVIERSSSYYTDTNNLNFRISKISDEYLPRDIDKPGSEKGIREKISLVKGNGKIVYLDEKTNSIKAFIDVNSDSALLFRLSYFPSWRAYVDGKEKELLKDSKGIILKIPQGAHDIRLVFMETPVEKAANLLSLAGMGILFLGTIYAKKRRIW